MEITVRELRSLLFCADNKQTVAQLRQKLFNVEDQDQLITESRDVYKFVYDKTDEQSN